MKNTALITGASSGIGAELAKIHAAKGGDLILVARREEELQVLKAELEKKHSITCLVWALDLTKSESIAIIGENIAKENIEVDILINNAGFGGYGLFHERDWNQDNKMISLNIVTLSALTHLILPQMVSRKKGKILNIASSAGFMPGPLQATYFATKAFVVSFSQAIDEEVREFGVTCTALCPGPVNTGFEKAAELEGSPLLKNAATASSVAQKGYKAMEKGRLIKINDPTLSFAVNWLVPLFPRRWVLKIARKAQEK